MIAKTKIVPRYAETFKIINLKKTHPDMYEKLEQLIENTDLSAEEVANIIKEKFDLL